MDEKKVRKKNEQIQAAYKSLENIYMGISFS